MMAQAAGRKNATGNVTYTYENKLQGEVLYDENASVIQENRSKVKKIVIRQDNWSLSKV